MPLDWEQVIVDSSGPQALGRWWASALGRIIVNDDPDEFEIRPSPDQIPGVLFVRVPDGDDSEVSAAMAAGVRASAAGAR